MIEYNSKRIKIERFSVQDQIDSKTNEFIEKIINKYHLKNNPYAAIKDKKIYVDGKDIISDDRIVEILLDDKLLAMQYQRRDDFNWTEVINIDFEREIDVCHKDNCESDNSENDYYIDEDYYCGACGSHSHKARKSDGYCYECGADDWEVEDGHYPI